MIRKTNGQPIEFYSNVAFNNEENKLSKHRSNELNEIIKQNRFKIGNDLKLDKQKHQDDALDTSLTMQEQLIIDLTYQNEIAHEKNLEHFNLESKNQNTVKNYII